MKKYLISYGDDKYTSQKEFFRKAAVASSFFDEIRIFGPEDIDPEFANEVGETLSSPTGGGFWLWKPYIIKETLDYMDEDDILVYCDAGCMINPNGKERFDQYIEMLVTAETGTIDFELPLKEYAFTKKEIFDYFNAGEEVIDSNQLIATVIILRKCSHTEMLINEWYEAACDNPFLFTNELFIKSQHTDFVACRNDQSVFSVIRKKYGANIIPDETYFLDFVREGQSFPFWATRLR